MKIQKILCLIGLISFGIVNFNAQHKHQESENSNKNSKTETTKASVLETKITSELAKKGFERFKSLEGKWLGKSTKGWTEEVSYRTIAGGSVVVANSFDAHPNETMLTMYHLDGERLMLTHYCVAKNQPRLVATSISEDAKEMTFTFLDGTNLPSRDKGHMDKFVIKFVNENTITSQWTWYQNGKESWMEEIKLERIK